MYDITMHKLNHTWVSYGKMTFASAESDFLYTVKYLKKYQPYNYSEFPPMTITFSCKLYVYNSLCYTRRSLTSS